jgi:ADP-heptose:LPS heptosyltransferase
MKGFRDIPTPKNILAIRFMRFGDVALLLPALAYLKHCYPESRLTLLTDERCAPLAELCPAIDEVMGVDRLAMRDGPRLLALKSMAHLVSDVRRRRFDLVMDFLSFRETNLLTRLSGAPFRLGMKLHERAYLSFCFNLPPIPEDKALHVSEMFQRIVTSVVDGRPPASPSGDILRLPTSAHDWAAQATPRSPLISLYVGAPVAVRRWPAEAFARVADFAVEELGASVALLAGPPASELAERVQKLCRNPERVATFDRPSVSELTAIIARSRLLVSNDTGPMHLGPLLGIRTLGLFSVGFPEHFRPLGQHSRFLRANPIEKISVDDVIQSVKQMWCV